MNRRVLHAVRSFSTGVLQTISTLCNRLDDVADFKILYGSRDETPKDFENQFKSARDFVPWSTTREINYVKDLAAFRELRTIVRTWKPDIIHAHSSKAGALCRLLTVFENVHVVYSPQGYSFLSRDLTLPKRSLYRALEWILGRLPHVTVASGTGELLQAVSVSRHVALIPNMIESSELCISNDRPQRGAAIEVVMVGGIRPQKNFRLFANVASRMQDTHMRFKWIGGGDIPRDVSVPSNVTVTGWLPRVRAMSELAQADVFMQTSLWEGLSIAVLEAMAMGLPVLAMPAVGNTELVVDGIDGYICPDAEAFEMRLRALASSSDERCRLGCNSHAIVERRHSIAANAPLWRSLYENYTRYERYGST